jgi:hypothetical protein
LLAVDVVDDLPVVAGVVLPAVGLVGGFAEAVLGLTGAAAFGLGVAGLGAGKAFWVVVGAAGVQVLALFGTLGAVIALLPPVAVSLNPKGFIAV